MCSADGVRSMLRRSMALEIQGRTFGELFFNTDIQMNVDYPMERRFRCERASRPGNSCCCIAKPDNIYRIDLMLSPDTDPVEERKSEWVISRVRKIVGEGFVFNLEWISFYGFTSGGWSGSAMVGIFVGDAAHVVSPFGARDGNGRIQYIDNSVWNLALMLGGEAPAPLLDR